LTDIAAIGIGCVEIEITYRWIEAPEGDAPVLPGKGGVGWQGTEQQGCSHGEQIKGVDSGSHCVLLIEVGAVSELAFDVVQKPPASVDFYSPGIFR
jgi:hypothetical protein